MSLQLVDRCEALAEQAEQVGHGEIHYEKADRENEGKRDEIDRYLDRQLVEQADAQIDDDRESDERTADAQRHDKALAQDVDQVDQQQALDSQAFALTFGLLRRVEDPAILV